MSIAVDKVICAKNNNNGINFKLNCKAGNHVVKYHTGTVSGQSSYKVSNKVTLKIMNWGNRGDVSKAYLIRSNIPDNIWVKKVVNATKQGLPYMGILVTTLF